MRCVGASEATSQESIAAPASEPIAPPIAASLTPHRAADRPPIAVPAAARRMEAMDQLGEQEGEASAPAPGGVGRSTTPVRS